MEEEDSVVYLKNFTDFIIRIFPTTNLQIVVNQYEDVLFILNKLLRHLKKGCLSEE